MTESERIAEIVVWAVLFVLAVVGWAVVIRLGIRGDL